MEDILLGRCDQMLELVIAGRKDPSLYYGTLTLLEENLGSTVSLDLVRRVRDLESKALLADDVESGVATATTELLERLVSRHTKSTLSVSMFASVSKLSRKQQELNNWLMPHYRLDVIPKEVWMASVDASVTAIRWLSFRAHIRQEPGPLVTLAKAVANAVAKGKAAKRSKVEDDEGMVQENKSKSRSFEAEENHYALLECLSQHAASGQVGMEMKRLRRADSDGIDISVIMDDAGAMTGLELKRFLNKEIIGTSSEKVMAFSEEISQLLYYMLKCDKWTGRQVGALIFAHLLFCVDVTFTNGKVERLAVSPSFPTLCSSRDSLLELYDRNNLYKSASSDPDFVFDTAPSDGFKGLVKLVKEICYTNGVPVTQLRFMTDDNKELMVAVGEELVYSGRNSVVLSCRVHDEEKASSILKVAPKGESYEEERFHGELDMVPGLRGMLSSGYVQGAGSGLRFIQLAHYGTAFSHLPPGKANWFAEQACKTLQGIHQLEIVHRDIKPDNFIVVGDTLYLNDFDLSCDVEDGIKSCSVVGTPLFRSPRLVRGVQAYDKLDDWMSLGLTFMYLLRSHRSQTTKVTSLRKIEAADWAPDVLKENVAAGLVAAEQAKGAQTEVTGLRKIPRKHYADYDDDEDEEED